MWKYVFCCVVLCVLEPLAFRGTFANSEINTVNEIFNVEDLRATLPKDLSDEQPTVLVALLVRNKAHVLPLFLTYFERLNYPKQRMALWIRTDHNDDDSVEVLELWLNHTKIAYHSVDYLNENSTKQYQNESSSFDWPESRFRHLIRLKEAALTHAQNIWADYIFYLDADALLTDDETLSYLTSLRLPIVAPMLRSEGLYSNYWCGMTPEYYYERTEEYKEIYDYHKRGVYAVPMIHSAVLIRLNYMGARYLTFDRERLIDQQQNGANWAGNEGKQCRPYDGPVDDIIVFAISANCTQVSLFVSNERNFGYILQPLDAVDKLEIDIQQIINTRVIIVNDIGAVEPLNEVFDKYDKQPKKTKITLNKIFMINLARRTERREKMELVFNEIGLDVEYFEAVDGKELNSTILEEMGIEMLPGYVDPYHNRLMTMGEIGCFLSHYRIWEQIVKEELNEVLILEDDIRFEPSFKDRAVNVLQQARNAVEYDLIYFGRKRLKDNSEPWVADSDNLVHVGYSYWTLGYVISLQGARKLLAAKPLEKLIPVDEFLPIMFNKHPNETLSALFPEHNLIAFSAAPLLLYPTHYTGEVGYISDTEDSELLTGATNFDGDDSGPQPKSDRELEFPVSAEQLNEELDVDLKLNTLDFNTKTHEEF